MDTSSCNEHVLDNPVWHALHGPLSRFAAPDSTHDFIRFDPEVSIFSAVEGINAATWPRIAEHIGVDGSFGLFRDVVPHPPTGWEEQYRAQCWQMIAGELAEPTGLDVVRLGPEDHAEMLALVQLTEAAPFFMRTPELGRYVGIRRDGRLLAMAGERVRVPGHVEISAVCTHPDAQGQGLASELTLNAANAIRADGDEAFLHVLDDNENAYRLYQKLGFVVRRKVDVVFAQWHGGDWRSSE